MPNHPQYRRLGFLWPAVMLSAVFWIVVGVLLAGCHRPQIRTYGSRRPESATFTDDGYALARLEAMRPRNLELFAPYLGHKDYPVRVRAALAVGRVGEAHGADGAAFAQALKPLLASDPQPQVRRAAAIGIWLIGSEAVGVIPEVWAAQIDLETRSYAIRALGRIAETEPKAAEASEELKLLSRLISSSALGGQAALALGVYGHRAQRDGYDSPYVPAGAAAALLTRFRGSKGDTRWAYGYALFRLKVADAVEDFALGLADPDPGVRAVCARGLGALSHIVLLRDGLQRALRDRDTLVAVESARALGERKLSGAIAITNLMDLVVDANRLDDPAARHVGVAAADALAALGAREVSAALARQLKPARAFLFPHIARAYVASSGDGAVPLLKELLEASPTGEPRTPPTTPDETWLRRQAIALSLAAGLKRGSDNPRLEAFALKLLEDPDGRVRWAAAESYATLAGEKSTGKMIELLADGDPAVVGTAAEKLGGFKSVEAADALVKRLNELIDTDPETGVSLVGALAKIGRESDHAQLQKLASSSNRAVALAAAEAVRAAGLEVDPDEGAVPRGFPTLPEFVASQDLLRAKVRTTKGDVIVHLFPRQAPLTVLNFARLARRGFYKDIIVHRVVPGFVAQVGCPRGDGWGGPGYGLTCELNSVPYAIGTLGMALAGRDTGGSQFFFTLTAQPHLDGNYTVFGRVVRGMDVFYRLERGDRILDIEVP